jgi:hypothetical protein
MKQVPSSPKQRLVLSKGRPNAVKYLSDHDLHLLILVSVDEACRAGDRFQVLRRMTGFAANVSK